MAPINFSKLPDDNPIGLTEPGRYFGTIEKAEMKSPKDATKKPYLNMQIALKNQEGKTKGKIFDIIADSDHEAVMYKLKRFILALELPIQGDFELKDLPKIVQGKQLIVDVTHDKEKKRSVVDMFTHDIFYPMAEAPSLFEGLVALDMNATPISAADAEDVISEY